MFKINDIDDIKVIKDCYKNCLTDVSCTSSPDELENELKKALEVYKTLENEDKKIVLAILKHNQCLLSKALETFENGKYFYIETQDTEHLGYLCFKAKYQYKLSREDMQELEYYIDFEEWGETYKINQGLMEYDGYFIKTFN